MPEQAANQCHHLPIIAMVEGFVQRNVIFIDEQYDLLAVVLVEKL